MLTRKFDMSDDAYKWAKEIIRAARYRAKKKGQEFSLSFYDVIPPKYCPVLGMKLCFGKGRQDNSPSIDRFDNSIGYIKSNIRVISWKANRLKSNATTWELSRILSYMRQNDLSEKKAKASLRQATFRARHGHKNGHHYEVN